jgi:hypothetical protein
MTAVTYHVPGAVLTEREHEVPLDHARPDGQKITLYSPELAAPDGLDRPYLIFQQVGRTNAVFPAPAAPPTGRPSLHDAVLQVRHPRRLDHPDLLEFHVRTDAGE